MPKRIIDGAAFGPEVLASLREAFDAAWSKVAHRFTETGCDEARNQLAQVIVQAARENSTDVLRIRDVAIRSFARRYPSRFNHGNDEQHQA